MVSKVPEMRGALLSGTHDECRGRIFSFGLMAAAASSNAWVAALFIISFLVAFTTVRAFAPLVEVSPPQTRSVQ
ncbi:hypothetical protein [Acidovorax sp. A1169]|uniref:hypothetical protein n=1 Tax=Acidovorax sp. A1169 TaxID=3059524 RepID=UPI00273785C8|nr:hypothetical protein [Acidovorax sp. A1169]MDP4073881.1 hypothetical protein [Acidovorax sp. A1169]